MIVSIGMLVISSIGGYYVAQPCDKIFDIVGNATKTLAKYPECAAFLNGTAPDKQTAVLASMDEGRVEIAASLNMTFGMALWVALALHAICIEIYVSVPAHPFWGNR